MPALQAVAPPFDITAALPPVLDASLRDASDPRPPADTTDTTDDEHPDERQAPVPEARRVLRKNARPLPASDHRLRRGMKAAIDAGALEQGCCEREFSALKKCFREVRVKGR